MLKMFITKRLEIQNSHFLSLKILNLKTLSLLWIILARQDRWRRSWKWNRWLVIICMIIYPPTNSPTSPQPKSSTETNLSTIPPKPTTKSKIKSCKQSIAAKLQHNCQQIFRWTTICQFRFNSFLQFHRYPQIHWIMPGC